jgi:hypothetical protein
MSMNYPIHTELYSALESILLTQAKKLVDDVAKHQNTDSKELWQRIKSQIKIGLLDTELDDEKEVYCPHPFITDSGAIKTRCRAPCLIGFTACPRHINQPLPKDKQTSYESVDRVVDYQGCTYFVDKHRIARDKNGMPRGELDADGVLVLFEKGDKPANWAAP